MKDEFVKQQSGEYYFPKSKVITDMQDKSRSIMNRFNSEKDKTIRGMVLKMWLKKVGQNCFVEPPFFCDFGSNTMLGENVYINTGCTILDSAQIEIGDFTMIGSGVQICTPEHPLDVEGRRKELERALPVKIGKDCWIGSGAIILPGVTIGDGTTIGAGSVVTKDIPSNCVAVGNPCKVIKFLIEENRTKPKQKSKSKETAITAKEKIKKTKTKKVNTINKQKPKSK